MSESSRTDWDRIDRLTDEEIDTSDIPPLSQEFFDNAIWREPLRPDPAGKQFMHLERITHDPAVMGGKPCIRGLRVTVGTILGLLASGVTRARILQAYSYLEAEDIDAVLAYAAWRLEEREEALVAQ